MVTYTGNKFAKDLQGSLGIVHAFVGGTDNGVVVTFGSDAYILDETRHLAPFQGKLRTERGDEKKPAGPDVQKRRGVGAGKRRVVDQDSSE
jgi:hypothetical protein